jgi:bZIP Maf transcription factor
MNMSVKELNMLLKSMKPADAANIKRRRRILKNKGYAASSRHRQTSLVGNLSVERSQLAKEVNKKRKYENLFFVLFNK